MHVENHFSALFIPAYSQLEMKSAEMVFKLRRQAVKTKDDYEGIL
jgi:hypothetical protein